ncbi:MAG: metal-dependent transcriptional regulator [Chloroflexi bacterium AL-W]|nr:metal-dependent transcriptional regulator [Chloroflexi bacterium AL-N1]NOK65365.1 metal-dependent transcriptional regulator [Chloroflexi bacterium AL-N10]NOK72369.1 metal-dependent transcriptional regulator [Chloroflexi bacterium AL-N5]NOK79544.1 metal-dependent transcriptional regulator [Chloroflexi bacterium AL-W]NOK87460.1 metal-dependent transcriptional regulator [Chloroflexi bacterium AL-N15]
MSFSKLNEPTATVDAKNYVMAEQNDQSALTNKMRAYLEAIYHLSDKQTPIISARLADWMQVTPPTVTNIINRMSQAGYIDRGNRGEITLTSTGFALAETIVRRHHLLECLLADVIGVPWHLVHQEALRLEHALSPELEERVEVLVGDRTTCPHGNPIPGSPTTLTQSESLTQVVVGQSFTVNRINEEAENDTDLLLFLQQNRLIPGTEFTVVNSLPTHGITLKHSGHMITLPPHITTILWGQL